MVTDALEVGVFIEHSVVSIQEKVKGVLVEEVHLEKNSAVHLSASHSKSQILLLQVDLDSEKLWRESAIVSRPD